MTASNAPPPGSPPEGHVPDRKEVAGDLEAALPSSRLLRGRSMVQIEHNGAVYQLRSRRLGKLILTK